MKRRVLVFCFIFILIIMLLGFLPKKSNKQVETVYFTSEMSQSKSASHPIANGTFIQWWMVERWTDEIWDRECQILMEAGMRYIILAPTAFLRKDEATGHERVLTIYTTQQKDFGIMKDENGLDYPDVVDACLKSASKYGLKVFLGLNFSDEWWIKNNDAKWLQDRVREGNRVAEELWRLYRPVYGDTLYGWYWCWEVDDFYFRSGSLPDPKQVLADAIKAQIDFMEASGIRLPLMLSPYMDWRLGTPEGYGRMWEYVLANSGLKAGDIFSPQDCIGSRKLTMNNFTRWFAQLRKAANIVPGLRLWANTETFDIRDWTSAPLKRVIRQMNDVSPYVDDWVTFAYSHYYSPNVIMPGYHQTYTEYVKTGTLEEIPPSAPTGITGKFLRDGQLQLSWEPSLDNVGVCGYYIFKNGYQIAKIQVLRANSPETVEGPATSVILEEMEIQSWETDVFEIQAFDFAGNVSDKAGLSGSCITHAQ